METEHQRANERFKLSEAEKERRLIAVKNRLTNKTTSGKKFTWWKFCIITLLCAAIVLWLLILNKLGQIR